MRPPLAKQKWESIPVNTESIGEIIEKILWILVGILLIVMVIHNI